MPSKLESQFTKARYIVSDGGRSSGAFICVPFERCNNRGSRCEHPRMQSPGFAATFQSPLRVHFRLRPRRRSCRNLSCKRETRDRFEDPRGIRASHDSARMAPRAQRSVRFPNMDDRMEWRRMEKELRARRVAPNANSDVRDNLLVNRLQ